MTHIHDAIVQDLYTAASGAAGLPAGLERACRRAGIDTTLDFIESRPYWDAAGFQRVVASLSRHRDAEQLRAQIANQVAKRTRKASSPETDAIDECALLSGFFASSDSRLRESAAVCLAMLAFGLVDGDAPPQAAAPREPYASALLALSETHADLLIDTTVDASYLHRDSVERWERLRGAAGVFMSRHTLLVQSVRALALPQTGYASVPLIERLHASAPDQLLHLLRADDECASRLHAVVGAFAAAACATASPLRELVAFAMANRLRYLRGGVADLSVADVAHLNAALLAFPASYAALNEKNRRLLLPVLDAHAVVACGATMLELFGGGSKDDQADMLALIARTPIQALRDSGLLALGERKPRWLLLHGLALNADVDAVAVIAAHLGDRAHNEYSRGLSLDRLERSGHSLAQLDNWAGTSLESQQQFAAKQKIPPPVAKLWDEPLARLLGALGEPLGRYLLALLYEAGGNLPRRARQILAHLPPAQRSDFAAYGIKVWIAQNGAERFDWLLSLVSDYADERVANDLAKAARAWMTTRKAKSCAAVQLLGRLPGTYGIGLVHELWQTRKFAESIQHTAASVLREAAQRQGLELSEFVQQLVPDFGLTPQGLKLDLGPYAYSARVQRDFSVVVVDADGKVSKTLPRAKAGENADLRGLAVNQLKLLGKNLPPLFQQQSARLLRALQTGKRWPAAKWRSLFLDHVLLRLISQSVVWSTLGPQGESLARWRVSESAQLVDAQDHPYVLPEQAWVGVAHLQEMEAAERAAWARQFDDYALLSPLDQLHMPLFAADAAERAAIRVQRADGAVLKRTTFGGLMQRWGYVRGRVQEGEVVLTHSWRPDVQWLVEIGHSPVSVHYDPADSVTLASLQPYRRNDSQRFEPIRLDDLPPALLATLLAQAEALKAAALA